VRKLVSNHIFGPVNRLQRSALCAAAEPERWAACHRLAWNNKTNVLIDTSLAAR